MVIKIKKSLNNILNLPRSVKTLIAISFDFTSCVVSLWLAYFLRLGEVVSLSERGVEALFFALIISLPIFFVFGLYRAIFRYSGLYALLIVCRAIFVYAIFYSTIICLIGIEGVPRTVGIIQPLILFLLTCSWRLLLRFLISKINAKDNMRKNLSKALVYGSGSAGRQLVKAMQDSSEILIKGFLDDDIHQQGRMIDGKLIYAPEKLKKIIAKKKISLILLALPSIERKRRNEIIKNLAQFKVAVRSIPGISELARGESSITDFLDLDIDDLLGRNEVEPFQSLMSRNIFSKTILVTGAGGSIGSELCRQIIKLKPKKLLLVEISEYALYSIHSELEQLKNKGVNVVPLLGSVQDEKRMNEIISIWKPASIYHTAAYKHVPIVEHNLIEGIKNNVMGTYQLAKISLENAVSNFVFVSTDKAVRPTNIMGASKRMAELCLQAFNDEVSNNQDIKVKTKFSIVRFGNVLDSSGSVIPKFRSQIKHGGPVTLTHKEITRYFMTITEAAQLVIQSGALAEGGDVFVLDMGTPIKIFDLAVRMIELSGFSLKTIHNPQGDIEITITGLRPGEKLYEELLLSENPIKTIHPKIFRSKEPFKNLNELKNDIQMLEDLMQNNDFRNILIKLKSIIIDYNPNTKIIDHTFMDN